MTWDVGTQVKVNGITFNVVGRMGQTWTLESAKTKRRYEFSPHSGLYRVA